MLDALTDVYYLLLGAILETGLAGSIEDAFYEVHNSNMSKLGEDGKAIYNEDGKVLKGPNYFKPDFKRILGE